MCLLHWTSAASVYIMNATQASVKHCLAIHAKLRPKKVMCSPACKSMATLLGCTHTCADISKEMTYNAWLQRAVWPVHAGQLLKSMYNPLGASCLHSLQR